MVQSTAASLFTPVKPLFDERAAQPSAPAKPLPRFLLSSLEPRVSHTHSMPSHTPDTPSSLQEKVDYGALIQELGGEYIELDYFTTKCTHLVVGEFALTSDIQIMPQAMCRLSIRKGQSY